MRIVSLASTIWTDRWMNRQQLLSRLGRRHSVVYSNAAWHTWDRHGDEWRKATLGGSFHRTDNVWVESVPAWMMRTPRWRGLNEAVLRQHARRWRRFLCDKGDGPLILHLFHPAYADYVDHLRPDAVVYQPYDWFEFMPGWNAQLEAAEQALLKRADRVITPSESFSKGLEKKSGREVLVVPNGVDIDMFEKARAAARPLPADLAAIPAPRIGYCGWLESHVDLSLVVALARRRPQWHFVFVGGRTPHKDDRLAAEIEVCQTVPNIHFLGVKGRTEVPDYMMNMDINAIPWRLEEGSWADVGYPLKLQEYMAAGCSVVSADLHSVRTLLSHVVRIASGVDGWETAIADALAGRATGTPSERIAIAQQNGWDRRGEQLESILLAIK
jgi:glycosyltransferase involved in cell wall biosynthesis